MADTKISDLASGNPAQSGDQIPIARAGANYKITAGSVSSLALATPLAVTGNSTAGAELRLPEDTDNGSNYVALKAPDALASNVTFTLPNADGSNGQFLSTNGSGTLSWASGGGSGDVVGPASSVDSQIALFNSTTGKVIKAATTTGLLKASSGVIAAAASGTDYAPATSGTSILKGNGSGGFSNAASGTDYAPATSGTSVLKGNGSGGFSNAAAGTDYAAATTGTSAQLLANSGSGGFSNVTVGSGLLYSAGTLTATGTSSGLLFYRLESGLAGANSTAVQQFLGVGVTLTSSTIYQFEALFLIVKTAGTTGHTVSIGFGGTATLNNIAYQVAWNATTSYAYATGGGNSAYTTAALSVATSSRTAANEYSFFRIMGSVSINAGGTFIPQYQLSAAPGGAYTSQPGSFMALLPVSNTGTWA